MRYSQRAAFAQGTTGNLRSQAKAFLMFCYYYGVNPFPATLDTVCMYAQFLSRSFRAVDSIKNYISGVKLLHVLSGLPFPHLATIELRLLVKGLAKLNPFLPRQALPITPAILLHMYAVMDCDNPMYVALWCAYVLAFFLFARKSNMVPVSARAFDPAKHLCRSDIMLARGHVLVYIKWSKTIQCADRYLLIPLVAIPGSPLCPRWAVTRMISTIKAPSTAPAFVYPTPQGLHTITHARFTQELRRLLALAGHNPQGYSGHSFRRGGASFALQAGVPGEMIRVHGDWKSEAYLRYLDIPMRDRSRVSAHMAASLPL